MGLSPETCGSDTNSRYVSVRREQIIGHSAGVQRVGWCEEKTHTFHVRSVMSKNSSP